MIVKTNNPRTDNVPKTFLTHTEAAAATDLRWKNESGFQKDWAIQLGETGEEQTEVRVLSSDAVAGTAGTVTAGISYEHPADTPIYAIKYDTIIFERATAGTTGTATPLTGGTVTIQADQKFTQFDDTSGAATYGYRSRFENSSGNIGSSSQSAWITSAGLTFYTLGKIRDRVKDKLWDASFIKDETQIDDWINEWKDQMINEVVSVNEDYSLGTTEVGFGTDGLGTVTTTDFSQVRRVWVTYNGTDRYRSTKQNINDFLPDETFSSTHPYHSWRGDSILDIKPADNGGTIELVYYQFGTTMVNDTDVLPLPMRSYTDSFVNYGLAQALFKDGKTAEYDRKIVEATTSKRDFVRKLAPRDKSGVTYIDIVEHTSGEGGRLP